MHDKLISKAGNQRNQERVLIGDSMIASLKDDPSFNRLYHGSSTENVEKEMIVYGEIVKAYERKLTV